jgi:hypothetical protein
MRGDTGFCSCVPVARALKWSCAYALNASVFGMAAELIGVRRELGMNVSINR